MKERQLTRLYYGTFNPEMTAYKALIPEWQALGLEVGCPSSCSTPEQDLHCYGQQYHLLMCLQPETLTSLQVVDVYSGFGQGYVQDAFGNVSLASLRD